MKKLVSIVTICALMVTIGAFSVFGDPNGGTRVNATYYVKDTTNTYTYGNIIIGITPLEGMLVDSNSVTNNSSSTLINSSQFTFDVPYLVSISFYTGGAGDFTYNHFMRLYEDYFTIHFGSKYTAPSNYTVFINTDGRGTNISDKSSNIMAVSTSGSDFIIYPTNLGGGYIQSGYGEENVYSFVYHEYVTYSTNTTTTITTLPSSLYSPVGTVLNVQLKSSHITGDTYNISYNKIIQNNKYNIRNSYDDSYNTMTIAQRSSEIKDQVQSILDAYTNNSQNAQNVTNGTQSNEQTLSTIATNEDTWFSQNDQALTATGIDDFTYTPQVMSGLTVISDQFNQLWLAIGDWNFVYTFSMMIGLVVLILRHNPQRKKSSSGGKSNANSS